MRVGVLTGGGDCPGLNAVIRAIVRKGERIHGDEVVGFLDGWRGVVDGRTTPLDVEVMRGTLPKGGTVIGTSRTNPYKVDGGVEACRANLRDLGIEALIAIGGEDTLGVASKLHQEGVAVVGVPKTIDNDLSATDVTFGFHTAVQIATDASTGCTPPPRATTGSSCARSWVATPATSPSTQASPAAPR
jgi:6-phosphofructokinase 1